MAAFSGVSDCPRSINDCTKRVQLHTKKVTKNRFYGKLSGKTLSRVK